MVLGFQVGVFGVLVDLIGANLKIIQHLLYRVRKQQQDGHSI